MFEVGVVLQYQVPRNRKDRYSLVEQVVGQFEEFVVEELVLAHHRNPKVNLLEVLALVALVEQLKAH